MTENLKKFLEYVSAHEEAAEKLKGLAGETDKAKAEAALTALAAEVGFTLTAEDFAADAPVANEVSDDELEAVAGGRGCYCLAGGGGGGGDPARDTFIFGYSGCEEHPFLSKTCACITYGEGNADIADGKKLEGKCVGSGKISPQTSIKRCGCWIEGYGYDYSYASQKNRPR